MVPLKRNYRRHADGSGRFGPVRANRACSVTSETVLGSARRARSVAVLTVDSGPLTQPIASMVPLGWNYPSLGCAGNEFRRAPGTIAA